MMYQSYAVAKKGEPNEWRDALGFHFTLEEARERVKVAIISGYSYGYIKQGFETVAYLTAESFLPKPPKKDRKTPSGPKN